MESRHKQDSSLENVDLMIELATILLVQRKLGESEDILERVGKLLRENPESTLGVRQCSAQNTLTTLFIYKGDLKRAKREAKKGVQIFAAALQGNHFKTDKDRAKHRMESLLLLAKVYKKLGKTHPFNACLTEDE